MVNVINQQTLYLGNCLEVLKNFPDGSFDFLLTDPPYGVLNVDWDDVEIESFTNQWFSLCLKKTKPDGGFAIFWSQKYLKIGLKIFNPDRMLIWHHPNLAKMTNKMYLWTYDPIMFKYGKFFEGHFGEGLNCDVLKYPKPQSNWKKDKLIHQAQKPLELIKTLLITNTYQNSKILDPFSGSGTTLLACAALNRKGTAVELNQEFYLKSIERLNASSKLLQ